MKLDAAAMQTSVIDFWGMQDFDEGPMGIVPRRLPAWTRPQLPGRLDLMVRMPNSVRLRFRTSSRRISMTCHVTRFKPVGELARPAIFDLQHGNSILSTEASGVSTLHFDWNDMTRFTLEKGDPSVVVFDCLPSGEKHIEVWLPHNALVEIIDMSLDEGATLLPFDRVRPKWVHYGSSISHCAEAIEPTGTWPAIAARHMRVDLVNLGFGGECHADQFVARAMRDMRPDLLSMKFGPNIVGADSMRERVFVPLVHGFLDTIREQVPEAPIVIISAILFPAAERHPGPVVRQPDGTWKALPRGESMNNGALSISRMRDLLSDIVKARNDPNLSFLSGLELFGEADLHNLPDQLHPNAAGYLAMGERFAQLASSDNGCFQPHLGRASG